MLNFASAKRHPFIICKYVACPAGLDSEKEKVDQCKRLWAALQPYKAPTLLGYPSGKRLWGIPFVSGGLGLSDPWSLLRHCRWGSGIPLPVRWYFRRLGSTEM